MGWGWTLYGGLPRDEPELRRFTLLSYLLPGVLGSVGLVILVGSILAGGFNRFWNPFLGGLFVLLAAVEALRGRERVKFARRQLVETDG